MLERKNNALAKENHRDLSWDPRRDRISPGNYGVNRADICIKVAEVLNKAVDLSAIRVKIS